MKQVALVIDDEVQIRRLLRVALEAENYQVHEAENGQQGLIEIANRKPAVILLDLGLPDLDGLEVLKRLREWSEAPVIVLTVRDDVQEKVAALDAGADDYVTKPFSTPELLARLRAAQRKTRPEEEISVFKNGDLVVDLGRRTIHSGPTVRGSDVDVAPRYVDRTHHRFCVFGDRRLRAGVGAESPRDGVGSLLWAGLRVRWNRGCHPRISGRPRWHCGRL